MHQWKFRPLLYKFKKSYGHTTPKLNLLVWSRPSPVVNSVSANFRQTQSCVWAKCRSMPNSQENHNFIRYTLFQKKTSKRCWAAKKCGYLKTDHSACSSIASYGRARCRAHTNVCTRIPEVAEGVKHVKCSKNKVWFCPCSMPTKFSTAVYTSIY